MPLEVLVRAAQQGLVLVVAVSLPVLAAAAIIGLAIATIQAATQVQDPTLAHLPRVVVVVLALLLVGPWMGRAIAAFAAQMWTVAG